MMMKSLMLLFAALLILSGCSKDPEPVQPSAVTTITGTVTDYETGAPIAGVVIGSIPPSQSVTTIQGGLYKIIGVAPGTYNLRASKQGYDDGLVSVAIAAGQSIVADIQLHPVGTGGGNGGNDNHPPALPGAPIPADNSTGHPLSLTLGWSCSDPDGDPLSYDVYLGRSNPPGTTLATGISASSIASQALDSNSTYYWFVVARDTKGGTTIGPVWRFTTGKPGGTHVDGLNSLDFGGTNSYSGTDKVVLVDNAAEFNLSGGSFTVESWIKLSGTPTYQWVASKARSNENADWLLGVVNGHLEFAMRSASNILSSPASLVAGRWYHVAAVVDAGAGTARLYIDGAPAGSRSIVGSGVVTSSPVYIGGREFAGMPSEGFQGIIHELRIWNTPRTQQQIQGARNARLSGNEAGLVAYWPLNEGEGTIVHDRSGKGHNGSLVNAPSWVKTVLPIP